MLNLFAFHLLVCLFVYLVVLFILLMLHLHPVLFFDFPFLFKHCVCVRACICVCVRVCVCACIYAFINIFPGDPYVGRIIRTKGALAAIILRVYCYYIIIVFQDRNRPMYN